jgi:aminomethyltransferase
MKETPLHGWHRNQGANIAEFGGYDMPLWYSSAKEEHLSVLTKAGLFDTSHMALVRISGQDAFNLLQKTFSRDLRQCIGPLNHPLQSGRCVYGVFLNETGGVVDDTILNHLDKNNYLCVVNAGMGNVISEHLQKYAGGMAVDIRDLTDQVGKMDLQGPASARILEKVLQDPAAAFEGMSYFSFKGSFDDTPGPGGPVMLKNGLPILLSRTGYTGEFGFEIFCDPTRTVEVWEMLLEAGRDNGITPCGLAARDSLRAGAVLPLSHQDIGPWPFLHNPWIFALPYNEDQSGFTKTFVGGQALLEAEEAVYTLPFVGNDLRKVTVSDDTMVVDAHGTAIGTVLTCVSDMGIGKVNGRIYSIASPDKPEGFIPRGLSCGFVKVERALVEGDTIELRDGRRAISVAISYDIRPDRTARLPIRSMV